MTYLKIGTVVAAIGLVALVSCTEEPPIIAQTGDIDAFAMRVLDGIQPASIAESREYCGYIYETETGGLAATAPAPGREDYCDLPEPNDSVLASYHTHGSFSDVYDNEVPSVDDVTGDFDARIDGYIGTPAGRVWLVDYDAQIARQLCNTMCITSDPNDDPEEAGFVPQTFTLQELQARFE
ncbi:DUF4329 domain-containing protein [Yoonia sp. GPGPB17]|uniref:DUF4329 domain-containing protein n=1 Tax=Yoonia sp. GPGPB17 TaxID=3026147 RepID=UPI0030BD4C72